MSKDMNIAMLNDFYGELLTEKQAEMIDLYYNEDLSLAEIAEPLGISRQGVRDSIKRGEKQLLEYEAKLGLAARFRALEDKLGSVVNAIEKMQQYENMFVHSYKLAEAFVELKKRVEDIRAEL